MNIKRAPIALTLLALSVLAFTGCTFVTSTHPVGETPLTTEVGKLSGSWIANTDPVQVSLVDAKEGRYRLNWNEEGPRQLDVLLREFKYIDPTLPEHQRERYWIFWNARVGEYMRLEDPDWEDEDGLEAEHWFWGRAKVSDGVILVWGPSTEAMAAQVEAGKLPGTVHEGNVVLGRLDHAHLELIATGHEGVLMSWDDPMVLYPAVQREEPKQED